MKLKQLKNSFLLTTHQFPFDSQINPIDVDMVLLFSGLSVPFCQANGDSTISLIRFLLISNYYLSLLDLQL
jgi:hypothetical protein